VPLVKSCFSAMLIVGFPPRSYSRRPRRYWRRCRPHEVWLAVAVEIPRTDLGELAVEKLVPVQS